MSHKAKRRNRNQFRARVLKNRPIVQHGTRLAMKRRRQRALLFETLARETRHLMGLERLYTDGAKDPRSGQLRIHPNEFKAADFKRAREKIVRRAKQLQAE